MKCVTCKMCMYALHDHFLEIVTITCHQVVEVYLYYTKVKAYGLKMVLLNSIKDL